MEGFGGLYICCGTGEKLICLSGENKIILHNKITGIYLIWLQYLLTLGLVLQLIQNHHQYFIGKAV